MFHINSYFIHTFLFVAKKQQFTSTLVVFALLYSHGSRVVVFQFNVVKSNISGMLSTSEDYGNTTFANSTFFGYKAFYERKELSI